MIKNKMVKIVGSAMVTALMFTTVVAPITANANEVEKEVTQTQEYNQELSYAIEEIKIAIDYLDNKDLTNQDNREYILAFATSAVERVRGMENEGHVLYINQTAEQVRKSINIADRLYTEMQNIKNAFDTNRDVEDKKVVLGYLNGTISEIAHSYLKNEINEITLTTANEFLHEYVGKLTEEIKGTDNNKESEQQEYNQELSYAIEEIKIAIDYLDNKDLTNQDNREYILAFTTAAVERVRGMENEGHVLYINQTAEQVRKSVNIADRLYTEMKNIKNAFDTNRDVEDKKVVLGYLNGTISEIAHSYLKNEINEITLTTANEFLHEYVEKLTAEMK